MDSKATDTKTKEACNKATTLVRLALEKSKSLFNAMLPYIQKSFKNIKPITEKLKKYGNICSRKLREDFERLKKCGKADLKNELKTNRFLQVALGTVVLLFFIVCFSVVSGAGNSAAVVNCTKHMRKLGVALDRYAQQNNRNFPEINGRGGLYELILSGYIFDESDIACYETGETYSYHSGHTLSSDVDTPIAACKRHKVMLHVNGATSKVKRLPSDLQ